MQDNKGEQKTRQIGHHQSSTYRPEWYLARAAAEQLPIELEIFPATQSTPSIHHSLPANSIEAAKRGCFILALRDSRKLFGER